MIGGFTPDGDRADALVVGYYDKKRLIAAGRVRAGLTPPVSRALAAALLKLRCKTCPFVNLPNSTHGRWARNVPA